MSLVRINNLRNEKTKLRVGHQPPEVRAAQAGPAKKVFARAGRPNCFHLAAHRARNIPAGAPAERVGGPTQNESEPAQKYANRPAPVQAVQTRQTQTVESKF